MAADAMDIDDDIAAGVLHEEVWQLASYVSKFEHIFHAEGPVDKLCKHLPLLNLLMFASTNKDYRKIVMGLREAHQVPPHIWLPWCEAQAPETRCRLLQGVAQHAKTVERLPYAILCGLLQQVEEKEEDNKQGDQQQTGCCIKLHPIRQPRILNGTTEDGNTPLLLAVQHVCGKAVERLVEARADVNVGNQNQDWQHSRSLLVTANTCSQFFEMGRIPMDVHQWKMRSNKEI